MNIFRSPPHGREVLSHGGWRGGKGEASTPAMMTDEGDDDGDDFNDDGNGVGDVCNYDD